MKAAADILIALVAMLHVYFLILEMMLWDKPLGMKVFRVSDQLAADTRKLMGNQGLYNGFLAAGLVWGVLSDDPTGFRLQVGFLVFVIIAGAYGAVTVSTRILVTQALPAVLAMAAVIAAG